MPPLAKVTLALAIALLAAGAAIYGVSPDSFSRGWNNILARADGSMNFRFLLQPMVGAIAAAIDGATDSRTGKSPYLWTMLTDPVGRPARLREGFVACAKTILIGLCIDLIYQFAIAKTFYPGEAVIVALGLGFVPYLLLRGPFERVAGWMRRRDQ